MDAQLKAVARQQRMLKRMQDIGAHKAARETEEFEQKAPTTSGRDSSEKTPSTEQEVLHRVRTEPEQPTRVRPDPESGDPLVDKVMRNHLKAKATEGDEVLPTGMKHVTEELVIFEPDFEARMQRRLLARRPPDDGRAKSKRKTYLVSSEPVKPADEEKAEQGPYSLRRMSAAAQIGRAALLAKQFTRHAHFTLSAVPVLLGVKLRRRVKQRVERRQLAVSFAIARMTTAALQEGRRVARKQPTGLASSSSGQQLAYKIKIENSTGQPMQGNMAFATRCARNAKQQGVEKKLQALRHSLDQELTAADE